MIKNKIYNAIGVILSCIFLSGCGAYLNQPVIVQKARMGEFSAQTERLMKLPSPEEPIVVGVYNFKDQTGQYKQSEVGSTFSTAVTQGGTSILLKALEDSKWFKPIERENLSNLLNERNIINSTRDQYRDPNNPESTPNLTPLLFAGILLEGGIVSYDTNIITGGLGARYFGVGGSTQYRQDRITVYLRAVSTSTGEVLKTVYVSKTILSQAVDVGLFRFVNFQRLLEAETGFTKNEPAQMAVQEAIEKSVEILIIEGIEANLWSTKDGEDKNKEVVNSYLKDKKISNNTGLYERFYNKETIKNVFQLAGGTTIINGDFSTSSPDIMGKIGYKRYFKPWFNINLDAELNNFKISQDTNYLFLGSDLEFEFKLLPYEKLSPLLYIGGGAITYIGEDTSRLLQQGDIFFKANAGLGLEYELTENFSLELTGEFNRAFSDDLDNVAQGKQDDFYYNISFGVNYNFDLKKSKSNNPQDQNQINNNNEN